MTKESIQINYRQELVGIRTFKTKYIAEIIHRGLNDYKVLTSDDSGVLRNKVKAHVAKLEEKWGNIVQKGNIARSKEQIQNEADILTKEAIKELKEIDNILLHTLDIDDTVDWEQLKDKTMFNIPSPQKELTKLLSVIAKPNEPLNLEYSNKLRSIDFNPKISFFDKIFASKKNAKIEQADIQFEKTLKDWNQNCMKIDEDNQRLKNKFQDEVLKHEKHIEKVKQKN